jgi:shikimate kinase
LSACFHLTLVWETEPHHLDERGGAPIVLVGGTSGSGKSTVAAKVARRPGDEHVIGTDSFVAGADGRCRIPLYTAPGHRRFIRR